MNAMPYIVTYNVSFDAHCIRAPRAHTLTHTLRESVSSFSCLFAYFNEISMAQQKENIETKHRCLIRPTTTQQQQRPHQPYCSRESNMCNDLCHTPFCTFAKLKIDEQMHVCTVSFVSDWALSTVSRDRCQWNDPIQNILCVNLNAKFPRISMVANENSDIYRRQTFVSYNKHKTKTCNRQVNEEESGRHTLFTHIHSRVCSARIRCRKLIRNLSFAWIFNRIFEQHTKMLSFCQFSTSASLPNEQTLLGVDSRCESNFGNTARVHQTSKDKQTVTRAIRHHGLMSTIRPIGSLRNDTKISRRIRYPQ